MRPNCFLSWSAQVHRPQSVFPMWKCGYYNTEVQDTFDLQRTTIDLPATFRANTALNLILPLNTKWCSKSSSQTSDHPSWQIYWCADKHFFQVAFGEMKRRFDFDDALLTYIACLSPSSSTDARAQAEYPSLFPLIRVLSCLIDLTDAKVLMTSGGGCLLRSWMKSLRQWLWMNSGIIAAL